MVDIQCKDGKYIIEARIHSEVDTNDIAKVQERFTSDCAYEFAEAMREAVNVSHLVMKEQKESKQMSHDLTKAIQDAAKKNKDLIKVATDISSTVTSTTPRVFLFKTDLPFDDAEKIGEWIYKSIKKGVLVIPECVEFIGVEDLFKTERTE